MFSYRHAFHAGNHADVLKHLVLIHSIRYLQEKDGGLMLIDTMQVLDFIPYERAMQQ